MKKSEVNGAPGGGNSPDVTGRDRMMWNVLTSWGGHMVFVIAGFVMPRMIDNYIGQTSLGIWDFSWSLVSYFGLAGLGVGSSVNRYVAKLRAENDHEGMNTAVSSVMCVQVIIAVVIGIMVVAVVALLPRFFGKYTENELSDARWVIAMLGSSLAVQQGFDSFRGVMTGCHRWDLHNAINSGSYGITVIFMIAFLAYGYGLKSMAGVYLAVGIATEIFRYISVRRICPSLIITPKKADRKQAWEMLSFGMKTIVMGLPGLVIVHGSSILVTNHLGPAMLAVFSRPIGLIRSASTFFNKYSLVLTPTTGSLQGAGKDLEINSLVIRATRYSVAMALPVVLFLSILGSSIMHVWMGPRYEAGTIMAILVCGSFLPMSQFSVVTILVGMNAHGRVGVINLVLSIVTMIVGGVALEFMGWSLLRASILVTTFMTVNGITVILFACKTFEFSFWRFFRKSFLGPMAACIPQALALFIVSIVFKSQPLLALGAGCAVSAIILAPIYWKYFFPEELRRGIRRIPLFYSIAKIMEKD